MTSLALLKNSALDVAPLLLGAILSHSTAEGTVAVRVTEVEAYLGERDPGSHAFRGLTPRTAVMFGPPGRLYAYFSYGMHVCANVVCSPEGEASAVLFRAGEVVEGADLALVRRPSSRKLTDLASGPARLCQALGISLSDNATDLATGATRLIVPGERAVNVSTGPRTGVSGAGGSADFQWRFWLTGDPTVSRYRAAAARPASAATK